MFPGVRSIPSVKLYHASIWLLVLSMWSGLSVFIPAHINVFVMSCTLNVIYIEFPFQESNLNQRQTLPCIIIIHSFSSDVDRNNYTTVFTPGVQNTCTSVIHPICIISIN